jgi:uracil-DNA glycosylase
LLAKPESCQGCPFYADGLGFVPDEIHEGATVSILAQNPGANEESGQRIIGWEKVSYGAFSKKVALTETVAPSPMIGPTGHMMDTQFLPLAGLTRGKDVNVLNVLKCRWSVDGVKTDKLPKGKVLQEAVQHCTMQHLTIPPNTKLIVAQGDLAWEYASQNAGPLLGKGDEEDAGGKWRGFLAPNPRMGIPTLGVVHLAFLLRKRRYWVPSMRDWAKVKLILSGEWPKPLPPLLTEDDREGYREWLRGAFHAGYIVVDTEFDRDTRVLSLVGLGYCATQDDQGRTSLDAIRTFQYRWFEGTWRAEFIKDFSQLAAEVPIVFWNAFADIPVIKQNMGIPYEAYKQIEDPMLAHSVLWSEYPHDLEFVDSTTGWFPKLKHLSKSNPVLYNQGDLLATVCAWESIKKEFANDKASEEVYRTQLLRLYRPRFQAKDDGIFVNKEEVINKYATYGTIAQEAEKIAQAYCGYPINLDSPDQLSRWLYEFEGLPVQKDKDTKKPTIGEDAIAVLRRGCADFDPETEKSGLTVDQIESRINDLDAHPLLEARAAFASADQIVSMYLIPMIKPELRHLFQRGKKSGKGKTVHMPEVREDVPTP